MYPVLFISVILYLLFCCHLNVGNSDYRALNIIIFYSMLITEGGISSCPSYSGSLLQ